MFKSMTLSFAAVVLLATSGLLSPVPPSTASAADLSTPRRDIGQRPAGYRKKRTKQIPVVFEGAAASRTNYLAYSLELGWTKKRGKKKQYFWHFVATNKTNSYDVGWRTELQRAVYKGRGKRPGKGRRRRPTFDHWQTMQWGGSTVGPRETQHAWSAKDARPGTYRIILKSITPELRR